MNKAVVEVTNDGVTGGESQEAKRRYVRVEGGGEEGRVTVLGRGMRRRKEEEDSFRDRV